MLLGIISSLFFWVFFWRPLHPPSAPASRHYFMCSWCWEGTCRCTDSIPFQRPNVVRKKVLCKLFTVRSILLISARELPA